MGTKDEIRFELRYEEIRPPKPRRSHFKKPVLASCISSLFNHFYKRFRYIYRTCKQKLMCMRYGHMYEILDELHGKLGVKNCLRCSKTEEM